ncbi:MAG: hypothetical protein AAB421_04755 [Patescibacteria group bacterium]
MFKRSVYLALALSAFAFLLAVTLGQCARADPIRLPEPVRHVWYFCPSADAVREVHRLARMMDDSLPAEKLEKAMELSPIARSCRFDMLLIESLEHVEEIGQTSGVSITLVRFMASGSSTPWYSWMPTDDYRKTVAYISARSRTQ